MMMFEMESELSKKKVDMAKGKPVKMERFKNQSCINGWYFQCQFGLQLGIANKSNNICLGTLTSESNHHVTVTNLCTFDCSAKGRTRRRKRRKKRERRRRSKNKNNKNKNSTTNNMFKSLKGLYVHIYIYGTKGLLIN